MESGRSRSRPTIRVRYGLLAIGCAFLLGPGAALVLAQEAPPPPPAAAAPDSAVAPVAATIPPEQLDSLVAPIALYPDALLAQTLVASTYPLEIIQLQQWLAKNPGLKDDALAEAVAKQPWDPSIQSMAAIPDVVKRLGDDIQWTTDLGNAFLAQQQDVMAAVQRMRKKAQENGALASNEQQTVETKVVEKQTVIIVESADPEIIYVPVYAPTVVYGPPIYAYPPIYYPPYPPGAAFVTFSMGVMWGSAWGGSCCGCGWGGNNIYINNNNNFNQINHNRGGQGGNGNWQHNPQHRGGAPYADQRTASQYGGKTRGGASASQQPARQTGGAGVSDRAAGGAGNRGGSPAVSDRSAGGAGRPSGADKVGNRSVPQSSPTARSGGGFSGGSGGYSGSNTRASSSRGSSSMGSRGGGGGGRGGGGRR